MAKTAPKAQSVARDTRTKRQAPATVPLSTFSGPDPLTSLKPRTQSQSTAGMASMRHTHQKYDEWIEVWRRLGHLYEGDGPYLDGTALVPHVRELLYARNEDGTTNFDTVVGNKRKYDQRRRLSRYENFTASIIDLTVDYQYLMPVKRSVDEGVTSMLSEWWEDVDGMGSSIDDWLKQHQVLTNVYGHLFVVMDRLPPVTSAQNSTPQGQKTRPVTLAQLGRPVLRRYMPPDALDWLAPRHKLSAVKFVEPLERQSLLDPFLPETEQAYFLWDAQEWRLFDTNGSLVRKSAHLVGELPVAVWYAKRRAKYPIVGRSLIRDGSLPHDHFQLISEVRELYRAQTFSMMQILLAENETVQEARQRLGDHAGTDSLIFSRGGASFIAPDGGPAADYAAHIESVERKMFRLCNLPYDNDSRDAESGESRRRKAADLNALLSSLADNAEQLDHWIARMFYQSMEGGLRGRERYEASKVQIKHPDMFDVVDMIALATDLKTVIDVGVGPTATKLLRIQLAHSALPDLMDEDKKTIEDELDTMAKEEATRNAATTQQMVNEAKPEAADAEAADVEGAVPPEPEA